MNQLPRFKKLLLIIYRSSHIIIKLVVIDQVAKWWFLSYLKKKPGLIYNVSSFLDMVHSWNYGISFGIFRNYYQYSNVLFIVINSVIIVYLWSILLKCRSMASFVGYSLIIGGAVGNLIDRFVNGAVFDFIYFHYHDYGFPVFNLADCFISLGVIFLLHEYYKVKKIVEEAEKTSYYEAQLAAEADRIRDSDYKH